MSSSGYSGPMATAPVYPNRGVFIAFEGGEGAGKSTQAERLSQRLQDRGHEVLLTREPGGTEVGNALRSILLNPETGAINGRTEALIYAADKAEHISRLITPALDAGLVVITDRYVDSSLAYQGAGRELDMDDLEFVLRWATNSLHPNLTVLLDVHPQSGLSRFEGRDRIESEPLEFHLRARQHFLDIANRDSEHYLVVDASDDVDAIAEEVWKRVEPWLIQV